MIVLGIGCRRGCSVEELLDLLHRALAEVQLRLRDLVAVCAPQFKSSEPGLRQLAEELGLPLLWATDTELKGQAARLLTHSRASYEHTGVGSVAEASALAGVERHLRPPGGAILLRERWIGQGATCALARCNVPGAHASSR